MNEEHTQENGAIPARGDIDFSMILASSVHDMKNSLGMLLNSVEELRQDLGAEHKANAGMNTLQYEAERIHNDLVQLLSLYRLSENTLSARIDEHYIPDFLSEQLSRHEPLLKGLGIHYSVEAIEAGGYFDRDLLGGVLNNVINNAIRYTRDTIKLIAREQNGYLVIRLEDNGQGYPEAMLNAGIDTDRPVDFQSGSTNLGLTFTAAIARLHTQNGREGHIHLENGGSLGGGVFEIWLP